jgi:spore germination protein (amino acid permease)
MEKHKISTQQLSFAIFLLLTGSALVYVPGYVAGQDAWLATVLGMLPGLFILYAVIKLHSMFPGERITVICTDVLGKWPGTILNVFFCWGVFLFLIGLFYDIFMFLQMIYPGFPRLLFNPLFILIGVYCIYQGLNPFLRLGELLLLITLSFVLLGFMVSLPNIDFSKLTPVLAAWKPLAAGSLYTADWPFDEVVILGLFLPLVSDLKSKTKLLYKWYLFSALVLVLSTIQVVAILGAEMINIYQIPLFQVYRTSGFGQFKGLEVLFMVLWFFSGMYAIILYYQGLNFILQDIFSLKNYKALIIPVGLCTVVFTLYMFPSDIQYRAMEYKYVPLYTFISNLFYPAILLAAAVIRKKTGKTTAAGLIRN